jgi:YHYH protein
MPYAHPAFMLALSLAVLAPLAAHPDHAVTQRQDGADRLVPATAPAPASASVSITIEGERRVIVSNGLPDHATGRFPNSGNPHRIAPQRHRFTVPLAPTPAASPVPLRRGRFGVALNGVPFEPGTAESWQNDRRSGWSYEAQGGAFSLGLDTNLAHVQPDGSYHYHGLPAALLEKLSGGEKHMTLVGWAADGYPIYAKWGPRDARDPASEIVALRSSYRLRSGRRPTPPDGPGGTYDGIFVEDYEYVPGAGELDACHGREGPTPEFPRGTYHYVLTEDFPFIPRLFHGEPDPSFSTRGGSRSGGGPGGERPPPPPRP